MPRSPISKKRKVPTDPKFNDRVVARMVSAVMRQGKKGTAEHIVYGALDIVAEKMKDDPVKVLKRALENVKPVVETKSRRVGGANYQVPIEIRAGRREALGMRWIRQAARSRGGRSMAEKMAAELMDAFANRGAAIKKREDVHRMAEANKAFAHYRW